MAASRRFWLAVAAVAALATALVAPGCATVGYYVQAARGQWALASAARPIDDWVADPATPEDLRNRLAQVRAIRDYASRALSLPDNGSYRRYADLGRPYVVWNVVAAPEFSTRPRQWCFPFAGCVSYKGWFDAAGAEAAASALRAEGWDAFVHGVPAYSTLGWFDDPVLNTYVRFPRQEIARLVFHELAHQVAYVPGDSTFNESFATCVEQAGVRRWLADHGSPEERRAFDAMDRYRAGFTDLVLETRDELDRLYAGAQPGPALRAAKAAAFDRMRARYADLKMKWGGFAGYDRWFAQPLGNAHLASVATYREQVPAFEALLAAAGGRMDRFLDEARRLAGADAATRERVLGAAVAPPR